MHAGDVDLVAFGTPFIANPDLVRRFRENLPLAAADPATFYGGGHAGYTDYPLHPGGEAGTPAPDAYERNDLLPLSALHGLPPAS